MTEKMPEWKDRDGRKHLTLDDALLCGGAEDKANDLPCVACLELLLELLETAFTPTPELKEAQPWRVA